MFRTTSLLLALAVIGVVGVRSTPAIGQAPPTVPTVPGVPSIPRGSISYLIRAEFGVDYEVDWTEEEGSEFNNCSVWRRDRGTYSIQAGSAETLRPPKSNDPLPGMLVVYPSVGRSGWADLTALGGAKAYVDRGWVQHGGVNWTGCSGARPTFRVLPDDCGERQYLSQNAILRAEMRSGYGSLKRLRTHVGPASGDANVSVVSITVPGLANYQACRMSGKAPEFPASFGLRVKAADIRALKRLRPGQEHRIQWQWSGPCVPQEELSATSACHASLDMHVDIRRWRPR
jgi:hypothetical protein